LYSYSQSNTLRINEATLREIVKNKIQLEYLKDELYIDDSLIAEQDFLIKNLKNQIVSYQVIDVNKSYRLSELERVYKKEKIKNRLILISSGVVLSGITYMWFNK
jgi:hypothetical protein